MEDLGIEIFVNADQIAAELMPSQPEAAASWQADAQTGAWYDGS